MTTAVIGATGRVGSEVVRGLLARGEAVAALVGDAGKARRAFGEPGGIPSIEQVTRLSVLNTSAASLGINQRAHHGIDRFASSTAVPYSTIRPAILSASLRAAAREVRASRTWTGLAGSGRVALIDHRDAAEAGLRVLTDPAL
jgi:uncharacterized protein YbjT (DUF2867 family)